MLGPGPGGAVARDAGRCRRKGLASGWLGHEGAAADEEGSAVTTRRGGIFNLIGSESTPGGIGLIAFSGVTMTQGRGGEFCCGCRSKRFNLPQEDMDGRWLAGDCLGSHLAGGCTVDCLQYAA